MKVTVIDKQDEVNLELDLIEKVSGYIADKFDRDKNCELNIIFAAENEIRELNKKYRNIDRETDVLAFPYGEELFDFKKNIDEFKDEHGFYTVGEIIISPKVASSNVKKVIKKEKDWNLNLEIILLITHGILHIYGYDHEEKSDKLKMESIQQSVLSNVRSKFGL